jgi:hypothetical protein
MTSSSPWIMAVCRSGETESSASIQDADKPPLDGRLGKFTVIFQPNDEAALRTLQQTFPTGVALNHLGNDGDVAFVTFYGER